MTDASVNDCIRYFILVYFGLSICAAITMVVAGLIAYNAGVSALFYTVSTVSMYFVIGIPMGAILPFFIGFFAPIPSEEDQLLVEMMSGFFAVIGSVLITLTVLIIAASVLGSGDVADENQPSGLEEQVSEVEGGSLGAYVFDVLFQYIVGVCLIPLFCGTIGSALGKWRPQVV